MTKQHQSYNCVWYSLPCCRRFHCLNTCLSVTGRSFGGRTICRRPCFARSRSVEAKIWLGSSDHWVAKRPWFQQIGSLSVPSFLSLFLPGCLRSRLLWPSSRWNTWRSRRDACESLLEDYFSCSVSLVCHTTILILLECIRRVTDSCRHRSTHRHRCERLGWTARWDGKASKYFLGCVSFNSTTASVAIPSSIIQFAVLIGIWTVWASKD